MLKNQYLYECIPSMFRFLESPLSVYHKFHTQKKWTIVWYMKTTLCANRDQHICISKTWCLCYDLQSIKMDTGM